MKLMYYLMPIILLFNTGVLLSQTTLSPEESELEERARLAAEVLGSEHKYETSDEEKESELPTVKKAAKGEEGMNDEDKDVLMKNLERTRSKYEGKDTDELFERVSKAYVRNLHRILKRKKR